MKITIKNISDSTIYKVFDCIKCKDIDNYIQNLKTDVDIIIDNININNLGIHLKSSYINCICINCSTITNLYIKIPKHSNITISKSVIYYFTSTGREIRIFDSNISAVVSKTKIVNILQSNCSLILHNTYVECLTISHSNIILNLENAGINSCLVMNSFLSGVIYGSKSLFKINIIKIYNTLIFGSEILKKAKQAELINTNLNFTVKDPITIYKKVKCRNYNGDFLRYAILTGHTFNDSLVNKGESGKYRTNHCIFTKAETISGKTIPKDCILISNYDNSFTYTLNKEIVVEDYDTSYAECSTGIHFFLTKEEAIKY